MASCCRSFHHSPQLPAPSLLFATERPHGCGHRCLSPSMGRPSGVCVLAFLAHSLVLNKLRDVQRNLSNTHRPILTPKGVISRAPESRCGSSCAPSFMLRLTQTAPLSSLAPEPPHAVPCAWRLYSHLGLSRGVANQLSLCRYQSSHRLYQHWWAWCVSRGSFYFIFYHCKDCRFSVFYAQTNISPSLQLNSIDLP